MENNQRNDGSGNGSHNNGLGGNHNHSQILIVVIVTLITLLIMSFFNNMLTRSSTSEEISYSQFLEMVDNGEVAQVIMSSDKLTIIPKNQPNAVYGIQRTYYTGRISNDPYLVSRLEKAEVEFSEEIPDTTTGQIISILLSFAPLILIWVVLGIVMRRMSSGGGMMGVGKSRAKVYVQKETGVLFKDVAGQDEAKESLQEVVDFLENPAGKYTKIGAKLPKGALLVGPPGTGKTLLAKAVAGEAKCPFYSLSGSDFVEMFVGVGASRVRDLFEDAKKNARSAAKSGKIMISSTVSPEPTSILYGAVRVRPIILERTTRPS